MALYTGLKCLACGEKFKDDDNIVVCPDCGTPYHRDCYKKNGECINHELHEKKGSFSAAAERAKNIGTSVKCENCGADNPPLAIFCEKCGKPIVVGNQKDNVVPSFDREQKERGNTDFSFDTFIINYDDKLCGIDPDESFDGVKTSELADFVGSNTFYFLPVFKLMKDRRRRATFNLPAMIFPTQYFAYRKMWGMMILSFILKTAIAIPSVIYFAYDLISRMNMPDNMLVMFIRNIDFNGMIFGTVYNLAVVLNYVVLFLFGVFTNWMYYKYCIKKIKKLKSKGKTSAQAISRAGDTSLAAVITTLLVIFLIAFVLAYIMVSP